MASGSLLKAIRERKERMLEVTAGPNSSEDESSRDYPTLASKRRPVAAIGDRFEGMADDLRDFFATRDGQASTNEILSHFSEAVSPADSFVFRSILKKLATLRPNTSLWAIKEEYR